MKTHSNFVLPEQISNLAQKVANILDYNRAKICHDLFDDTFNAEILINFNRLFKLMQDQVLLEIACDDLD